MLKWAELDNGLFSALSKVLFLFFVFSPVSSKSLIYTNYFFIISCWSGRFTALKNYPVYTWWVLRAGDLFFQGCLSISCWNWKQIQTLSIYKNQQLKSAQSSIFFRWFRLQTGETDFHWTRWPGETACGVMILHSRCFSNSAFRQISLPFGGIIHLSYYRTFLSKENPGVSSL